ncbi:LrgB family protein [Endozoicomonas sp. 8E]|uniref:LrgB family protein n=1 Tax=Endozoicomonas sp. 8E TaxID=3035692 RepID=UPI002938E00F|nr:LrgB family protein [Endozoicomonas sp. 8E]WOG27632.1 LrgB family protein [Endozoicomonas sp. 8E]
MAGAYTTMTLFLMFSSTPMKSLLYCSLTVAVYLIAWKLQNRFKYSLLNPLLISILVLVGILLVGNIPYSDYQQGGDWLSNLLGIAVVALGVPLYQQMRDIHRELPGVILVVFISSLFALVSTVILAVLAGADGQVAISLAPKSVTTPIAVMIVDNLNGVPSLTAIAVILTGLMGAIFGLPLLSLLKITDPKARGIAMGTACHALGTARMAQSSLKEGAYSALALVLSASISALLAPWVVPRVLGWLP